MWLFKNLFFVSLLFLFGTAEASFKIKNGRLVDADCVATLPPEQHFQLGKDELENNNWKEAAKQFRIITLNFPYSEVGPDSFYYLGMVEFFHGELDLSNQAFSEYLKCTNNPLFFEETIKFKFEIANCFRSGAKRHLLGWKRLPKWASGRSLALEIYDEIINSVPCHNLAAWSLFAKAQILREDTCYRESIDTYQTLIRRFLRHELAPESYLAISKIYIEQSQYELQNPDLLAFAQLNLQRFRQDFPREERMLTVEQDVCHLREIYAKSMFETGQFYERKQLPTASVIYYKNVLQQFPDTQIAKQCQERLKVLTGNTFIPDQQLEKSSESLNVASSS